jgi:toxin ParE1/3/4
VLIVSQNAQADISQAATWYEHQRKGLGLDFILAVEAELSSITRTPLHNRELRLRYRRGIVKRFPYAIFYRMENKTIMYGISAENRGPGKEKYKLPGRSFIKKAPHSWDASFKKYFNVLFSSNQRRLPHFHRIKSSEENSAVQHLAYEEIPAVKWNSGCNSIRQTSC